MATPAKIDEQTRRRPEFVGDVPITLCDNQIWWVPKPRIVFAPRRSTPGSGFELKLHAIDWGPSYYEKLDALLLASQRDDLTGVLGAQMDLACALLLRNYDLTDDELVDILWFDLADPANESMRHALMTVAQGIAPKPAGDGSSATS